MHRANGDSQRLGEHHHAVFGTVGIRHALLLSHGDVVGKTTVHMGVELRAAHELHAATDILFALQAQCAAVARLRRVDCDPLPHLQRAARGHGGNHPDELMPQHQRVLEDRPARLGMLVIMNIGAAEWG